MSNLEKLANAVSVGPIRAIGPIVYDAHMNSIMTTTELEQTRHELYLSTGAILERTDSGGSPTWDLKEIEPPPARA